MSHAYKIAERMHLYIVPVGSRVTVDPPPTDTDADYLALISPDDAWRVINEFENAGWTAGGSLSADSDRATFRKGEDNVILTWSRAFYSCFLACTEIAKRMNLRDKADRVALFDEARRHWPGVKHESRSDAAKMSDMLD